MRKNFILLLCAFTLSLRAKVDISERPFIPKTAPKCAEGIKQTGRCFSCSLDQWAKRIMTLKERPAEFSTLPSKKDYQANILTLDEYLDVFEKAAQALKKDLSPDALWLKKKSLVTLYPDLFNLTRPSTMPLETISNFIYRPYAQKLALPQGSQIAICADFHGSIHSLIRNLEKLRDLGFIDNKFKILKDNFYMLFLGDYMGRGIYGVEVTYTVARLLIANPERVILMRGNHEDYALELDFRNKHLSEKAMLNIPSFIDELYFKFDLTPRDEVTIFRLFDLFPVVCYLGCSQAKKIEYMCCCHGGLEIGYNPYNFLNAPLSVHYEFIDKLWRRKYFNEKLSKVSQDAIKLAFGLDVLCNDIQDFVPTGVLTLIGDHLTHSGFMWSGFNVNPRIAIKQRKKTFTGWVMGQKLTEEILKWGDSPKAAIRGLFRAHDHNNETGGPLLNHLCCSKGYTLLWDKVFTLLSAPDSRLDEEEGEACFTYDSFIVVTLEKDFDHWQIKHYWEDSGNEQLVWNVTNEKKPKACADTLKFPAHKRIQPTIN